MRYPDINEMTRWLLWRLINWLFYIGRFSVACLILGVLGVFVWLLDVPFSF